MSDQLDILSSVAKRLENAGIPYMLTGSVAMNFYAVPRMTRDIDIIAEVLPKDSSRLYHLFKDDCYVDQEDILDATKTSGSFNMIHNKTLVKIDVLMRRQDPYRMMEFNRRKKQRIFSFDVYVVSPEDLNLTTQNRHAMKDTAAKVTERLQMLYDRLPGERRLEMGCGMFDDVKSLATAGILAGSPGIDAAELKELLFRRLFRNDFPPKKLERILDRLAKTP